MLKTVFVENFMRLNERVSIDLGPVTVLVGANGSGKSSILKAVHWSIRCATLRDASGKTTLEQMDYTPSREFLELAHKKRIQNKEDLPKIKVGFIDDHGNETVISINAARNEAGARTVISGPLATALTDEQPQTAYIPGLAGLAEVETVLASPVLHRRAASGEGGSVLRHILLDLAGTGSGSGYTELNELNSWVGKVINGVRFWVKFDRLRDVNIDAQFWTPDMKAPGKNIAQQRKPLEMAGTGFLQVVQIFAYLLKFKPRLLLIDEPDAHLHPGTQELLIKSIEEAAVQFPDTQFLLTTHSPNLVRACGAETRVHWINDGLIRSEDEQRIRLRMGWGALDKEIILFSEDEKINLMQSLISQWPDLSRKVLVWPTFGAGGLPSGEALAKLRKALGIGVLVHRDRDFMSDEDCTAWCEKKGYIANDIPVWITPGSDIEASFVNDEHISVSFGVDREVAKSFIEQAIVNMDAREIERDFNNALAAAISGISGDNRSIISERWRDLGGVGRETIKGKVLLSSIEVIIRALYRDTPESRRLALLPRIRFATADYPVCLCLKGKIIEAIAGGARGR
ncbi:ATP-dependent endonuclease [Ancylobacter sp. IITR112]|uniref:ATP-dependent nuclease n=1 Tax=Ancylobacter sp. IITR112 TaxID=3138073 RepID=UPI00352A9D2D